MVNLKLTTFSLAAAMLVAAPVAVAATPTDIVNDNYDFTFPCDGTPHRQSFPVGHMSIVKAAWDLNFNGSTGSIGWLVVTRRSDAAYLLFDMSNHWHNQQDWPAPYFNTTPADTIDVTGSCYGAPSVYGKVQVWYLE